MPFKFARDGSPRFDISQGDLPFIIAHRGASSEAPENTMPAFVLAAQAGEEIVIELDVRLTRDGHLVVIHDRDLARTTNGAGRVSDFTLTELKKLDAGYRFSRDGRTFPYRGKSIVLSTLDEVLAALPQQNFLVELKDASKAAAQELASALARHNAFDRVIVILIGVKHKIGAYLRTLDGRIRTGHTSREIVLFMALSRLRLGRVFRSNGMSFEVPRRRKFGWRVGTRAFINQARKQGKAVFVWTVNDPVEMRKWLSLGATGLMTDSPQVMKNMLVSH